MNKTVDIILGRRSIRAFSDKMISEEELKQILECGLYAPSARNRQNWHFTIIKNKERIDEISELALKGMLKIGIEKEPDFHIFYHAPIVIVLSSKIGGYSEVNAGCAAQNMSIAAESLGIGSCIIGQTRYMYHQADKREMDRLLKIPEGYGHDISICFGYPVGDKPSPKPRKENIVDYIL
ncbi:nitroreductase family protein [Candidatus Izemoplasma sp. B36]|uniref:nitroreductase family protein n=1 Tax=Candidatus Izemoplasma sp. B36 TaxID=3242468 RepID=UPI0035589EF8